MLFSHIHRKEDNMFMHKIPVVKNRGVHLDLKGLPPTFKRLLEIVDLCGVLRINFILFEMEDMFPWESHPILRSKNAYSKMQMKTFYARCRRKGIQVIPLVQSYGHMENVLLQAPFKKYREQPDNPRDVCPLKGGAREIILGMLKDVLRVFPDIYYFHLGGDEAGTLGTCPQCRKYVEAHGKCALYLEQLDPLMAYLNSRHVRPILWHDMMAKWTLPELKQLKDKADLMVWVYNNYLWDSTYWNPARKVRQTVVCFQKAKIPLWGAGAVRCGGEGNTFPDIEARAENIRNWASKYKKLQLKGLALGVWSRGDTLTVPYGTLENALETLALSAKIMWDGAYSLKRDLKDIHSSCSRWIPGQVTDVSREFQKWLDRAEWALKKIDLDRGIREGGPYNVANIKAGVRMFILALNDFKSLEKKFLRVMQGRAFPSDVRQWLRAHKAMVCDRFAGLRRHIPSYVRPEQRRQ